MKPTLQRLQQASTELLYLSELEYHFEVILIEDALTSVEDDLLELTGQSPGIPTVVSLAQFFSPMTKVPSATSDQNQTAKGLQHLKQVNWATLG